MMGLIAYSDLLRQPVEVSETFVILVFHPQPLDCFVSFVLNELVAMQQDEMPAVLLSAANLP
jgi:hypothetical protein